MKKNRKILIAAVIILITIIITCINLYVKLKQSSKDDNEKMNLPPAIENHPVIEPTLQKLTVKSYYDTVKVCVNEFFKYYSGIYNPESYNTLINYKTQEEIERVRNDNIEAVYNILDESYIEFDNITIDTLQAKLSKIPMVEISIDDDIYVSQKNENISLYFVTGKLTNNSNAKTLEFNVMLCMDMKNRNYSVFLGDYVEKFYPNINIGETISFDNIPDEIVNKTYNTIEFQIGK